MSEYEQFPEYEVTIYRALRPEFSVTWSVLPYDMSGPMIKAGKFNASSASKAAEDALNKHSDSLDDGEYVINVKMKNGMKQCLIFQKGILP